MSVSSGGRAPGFLGRVLDPSGDVVGTCFQVSPGVLVTAWHVLHAQQAGDVGDRVRVAPLRDGGDAMSGGCAAVVVRTDPEADLAVLTCDSPLPASIAGLVDTDSVAVHTPILTCGVPELVDRYTYGYLDAPGHWAGTAEQQGRPLGQMTNNGVLPGMSGAPVWRVADDYVIGVVTGRYNSVDSWARDRVWVARVEDLRPLLAGLASPLFVRSLSSRSALPLPAPTPGFAGRVSSLARLDEAIRDGASTIVLHGMPGVGKTALAVHAVRSVQARFPDGVFFVDLHRSGVGGAPVEPAVTLHWLLQAVGIAASKIPETLADRRDMWRAAVNGRRLAIVLDDAAGSAQVRPVLPDCDGPVCVITSRRMLVGLLGAFPMEVAVLDPSEAVEQMANTVGSERVRAQQLAAERIVGACGLLPLAVAIVAAHLRFFPAEDLAVTADRLVRVRARLDELAAEDVSVRTAFQVSFDRLEPDPRDVFVRLGLHPGPTVSPLSVATLASVHYRQAERLLQVLVECHLVEATGAMHDLLRQFAQELADRLVTTDERRHVLNRMVNSYANAALIAHLRLSPELRNAFVTNVPMEELLRVEVPLGDAPLARTWLLRESRNLSAIITASPGPAAVSLASRVGLHLAELGQVDDAEPCLRLAAQQAASAEEQATALRHWATFEFRRGRRDEAAVLFKLAYRIADEIDDDINRAGAIRGVADVLAHQGEHGEAESLYRNAYEIGLRSNSAGDVGGAMLGMAMILARRGDIDDATELLQQAREIFTAIGDDLGTASATRILAAVKGEGDPALLTESEAISETVHDLLGRADALTTRGFAALDVANPALAITYFENVLQLGASAGTQRGHALIGLSTAQTELGDLEAAAISAAEALRVAEQSDDPQAMVQALLAQARVANQAGDPAARRMIEDAHDIAAARGVPASQIDALAALGWLSSAEDRPDDAWEYLTRSLTLAQERQYAGRQQEVAEQMLVVGRAFSRLEQYDEALLAARTAQAVWHRFHNADGEARALRVAGDIWRARQDHQKAIDEYQQMYTHAVSASNLNLQASALLGVAFCHADSGNYDASRASAVDTLILADQAGARNTWAEAQRLLGGICANEGDLAGATEHLLAALSAHADTGYAEGRAAVQRMLAGCARLDGQHATAAAHLIEAFRAAVPPGEHLELYYEAHRLADDCLNAGDGSIVRDLLVTAVAALEPVDLRASCGLRWKLSYAHEDCGDLAAATAEARRCGEIARSLGSEEGIEQAAGRLRHLAVPDT